jgi:DNA-binding response OmpR family regulator
MTARVLVVEDNQDIAEAIGEHLRIEGFSADR